MIYKKPKSKSLHIEAEKYIFGLLIFAYILGICTGCFFVFSDKENVIFTTYMISRSPIKITMYFIFALVLKYSGILSSLICLLPLFMGIQNSAYYCNYILSQQNGLLYTTILSILKDTSIILILVLYITLLVSQIIKQKYNVKRDFKYFTVYFIAAISVLLIEFALTSFIF